VFDNMSTGHLYGGLAARSLSLPAVLWQQIIPNRDFGGPAMTHAWVDRLAARVPAAAVVVHSDLAVAGQRELTPDVPVHKVHQGIDLALARRAEGRGAAIRAGLGLADDEPLVGIVGWLHPWKGQDVFLRCAAEVAARHDRARFVVVGGPGDAAYEELLRTLAAELGLGSRLTMAGHQSDPYPWFDALDVLVHASWGSPFDLVVIEAMALGKAVVATDQGGTGEVVVVEGESGHLVAPGDHGAMARTVLRYLEDPEHRAAMGAAARERSERFTHAAMAARMAEVLDGVLAGSG
jgi:glycosyltransferase involved in cell wall biosynthesis